MRNFSDLLAEYLNLRDKLRGNYYDDRAIAERWDAGNTLDDLANEIDEYFAKQREE